MKITIVFASYNGGERLPLMLDALTQISYTHWDIIAVDNNSSDNTLDILRSYEDRLPLTILTEERKGKSYAMNFGLDHIPSDTDLVILTDDDVIADVDWLQNYARAYAEAPEYDIFGGEIRPYWQAEPEGWVRDYVNTSMVFALNEGTQSGEINPEMVFGPNSAFRAHLFTKDGVRFPVHVGPKSGGSYPMGNDTALAQILVQKGCKAWHVQDAIVRHIIPASHIDEGWILKRYERYGWGRVLLHPEWFQGYDKPSFAWLKKLIKFTGLCVFYYPFKLMPRSRLRYRVLESYHYEKGVIKGISSK